MNIDKNKFSEEQRKIFELRIERIKKSVSEKKFEELEEVLFLVFKFNLSFDDIISAIIIFEIENGISTFNSLEDENKAVQDTVKTVYDLEQFNFNSYNDEAHNIQKVFISLVKNLTVVILVLSKLLVKMRRLESLKKENQDLLCKYANEIYAPLASRLGFSEIKGEMEDICLKHFNPIAYEELENLIKNHWRKTSLMLKEIKIILSNMLKELGISGKVYSRQKHISSVYRKLQSKNISISQIYDFAALRVVVQTEEECYNILGKIHGMFKPMSDRIKDYIANPKPNGYQSLHTTIIYTNEKPVEIQIRTEKMHQENELGVSAHFLYKEKKGKKSKIDNQLLWVRRLVQENKESSAIEFVDALKMDLYPGKIFVQTPKGKVVELPENACVLDFAYAIHSDLGNSCSGAKVNDKFCSISTILKNNDKVEIITSANVKGPTNDWLKMVKTSEARNKINAYFRSKLKDENIKTGKILLEKYLQEKNYSFKELTDNLTSDFLYEKFSVKEIDGLLAGVGFGNISVQMVANRLIANLEKNNSSSVKIEQKFVKTNHKNKNAVIVADEKSLLTNMASCCNPVLGDEIVAYTTRGRGISIHRKNCPNLKFLDENRLLPAKWASSNADGEMQIKIVAENNSFAIAKLTSLISNLNVAIVDFNSKVIADRLEVVTKLKVKSASDFEKISQKIKSLNFVIFVNRI